MPRDNKGIYTLPKIAISGSNVGQVINDTWQNTTFQDIYNAINRLSPNNLTLSRNITSLLLFDADLQIIRTTSLDARVNGNLKLKIDNTPSLVPKGAIFYHDSRYKKTVHKKIGEYKHLDVVCNQTQEYAKI